MFTLDCFTNLKEITGKVRNLLELTQVFGQETSGVPER